MYESMKSLRVLMGRHWNIISGLDDFLGAFLALFFFCRWMSSALFRCPAAAPALMNPCPQLWSTCLCFSVCYRLEEHDTANPIARRPKNVTQANATPIEGMWVRFSGWFASGQMLKAGQDTPSPIARRKFEEKTFHFMRTMSVSQFNFVNELDDERKLIMTFHFKTFFNE